jgi:hypothetical protein
MKICFCDRGNTVMIVRRRWLRFTAENVRGASLCVVHVLMPSMLGLQGGDITYKVLLVDFITLSF